MPEEDIEADFTNLRLGEWRISSEYDEGYNCIAFAVHDTRQFWDPDMIGVRGYYWPPGIPRDWRVSTLIRLYELHGFRVCENADLESGFEKVAIYATSSDNGTHAARQKDSGIWTSKLGPCEDIEHGAPSGLEGDIYGEVVTVMKRRIGGGADEQAQP
jgi:hypothetical protein